MAVPTRPGLAFGSPSGISYTPGMKTAISVPDRFFKQAERHARRTGKSRSQLYTDALAEYLARHTPDAVTERMDEVCAKLGGEGGGGAEDARFTRTAARRILGKETW